MTALDWDPSSRKLRQFSAAALLFLLAAAGLAHWRGGGMLAQAVPLAFAIVTAVAAVFSPTALRLPYVILSLITLPIGMLASHLVLGILFFGVITPLGVLARLVRPDPLEIQTDPPTGSHWKQRGRLRDKASYLRQA